MKNRKFKTRLPSPTGKAVIVPSVLSADFSNLAKHIKLAQKGNPAWFQVDVMDGHFVDNISFGPLLVKTLTSITNTPIDAHLMIENPGKFITPFAASGADLITVHYETVKNSLSEIKKIKKLGIASGIAINPSTPVNKIKPFLKLVDLVLIMTVNPGFGGQKFISTSLGRIKQARALIKNSGRKIWLQVDGGINGLNARKAVKAGADCLVAGSYVFGSKNISKTIKDLSKSVN
ncbi:MAG TPA: ribulose-phosphate 3-epimerase [Elusimicrobiales bacterium]|nr:ribulose-phosphate 3-epimerase [Elusimicrobiales bacterium]